MNFIFVRAEFSTPKTTILLLFYRKARDMEPTVKAILRFVSLLDPYRSNQLVHLSEFVLVYRLYKIDSYVSFYANTCKELGLRSNQTLGSWD